MEKATKLICLLFLQCLVTVSILSLYHFKNIPPTNEIIVIDFKKVMKEGLSQIAEQELNEEGQKQALNQFSIKFRKALQSLSSDSGKTIFIKEVVLEGARDETDNVLAELFRNSANE
ncbi:TrbI F-type domain-containing protein [Candidatus Berkiella aquae]|uniref:TrbI F-type domain-containing protein n=1 Tax=Candidatus Berkiella aquae TaxID=295108 RepID=A0A0Q9YHZ7_9GAMM|nr:TrbI F-type domain-containing protein [Candidatus Berkiella aquae]MCS5712765.1 TrbI F-type domain-containing protein [Candidatus Berkiella aquae]